MSGKVSMNCDRNCGMGGGLLSALGLAEEVRRRRAPDPLVIALAGGGGKTTSMEVLAREAAGWGRRVLVTTSTHIGLPETGRILVWRPKTERLEIWEPGEAADGAAKRGPEEADVPRDLILTGGSLEEKAGIRKLTALPEAIFRRECARADLVLIEADGAKRLPTKLPAAHEPVIPEQAEAVIGCMGLSALGRPAGEVLFRREQWGISPGTPVTEELAAEILASEAGTRKGVGRRLYRVILNQCDTERELDSARQIGRRLAAEDIHGAAVCFGRPVWRF